MRRSHQNKASLETAVGAGLLGRGFFVGYWGLPKNPVRARFWLEKVVRGECEVKHLNDEGIAEAAELLRELDKMTSLRKRVLDYYTENGAGDEGCNVNVVAASLGLDIGQVKAAVEFLSSEGHLYSTIDEDHHRSIYLPKSSRR